MNEVFNARKGVEDPEIIQWLGRNPYYPTVRNHQCVWITEDWNAQKLHGRLIVANQISVWWIREEKTKGLTGLQELQLISFSLVIQFITEIINISKNPVYLKASLNGRRPKLERLISNLLSPHLDWETIPLTF